MTHAEYVSLWYPPLYEVCEPGQNLDDRWYVLVLERGKVAVQHDFDTLEEAQQFEAEKQLEFDRREVEVNEDDPQADYERSEMAAIIERARV